MMSLWSWKAGLAGVAIIAASAYAVAQMPGSSGMHGQMHDRMMSGQMPQGMHGQMDAHRIMGTGMTGQPTLPGQAAFGTIQEVVRIMEGDPTTNWAKVNISALREHLIDMDEVTLRAVAAERPLDNGIEIAVTGTGRTRDAIQRMIPAHVQELNATGWNAKADELPDGEKLTVTSPDATQVTKLKALGFMGIMVQGAHHQAHHLMMAKGNTVHLTIYKP
jgi:hypothetical protein